MSDRKKLLFVVESMGGGVFTYIVDLANELVEVFDIYIAYGIRPQTPKNYKDYFNNRIQLIEVKNFTRSVSFSKDIKAYFEIKRIAKCVKPDVIHLHSSKAGVLGRWAFNGRKIPMFYTPHGYSFLMLNCSWKKRLLYKFIEKVSSKRFCTTISCSEGEHIETLKLTKRAMYVNNGINISELQQLISHVQEMKERPFTVYTLGRICHQKNPEAFNEIAERLPEVRFLWIGDGELKDKLKSPNIEITGWVDREEALKKSINADVFLLTSLWEGLPISLLESMYMKKLCVVSNVIGNHDVIHNGVNGYVCTDVDSFVEAIQSDMIKNTKLIENAFDNVMSEYNTKVMAQKYIRIYNDSMHI
ncbi:glycosyl transferase [Clostridium sp. Bc-iso-3]|nr:glycosyl transferase [Clostridium sp. Bc-iso-3]